jgi:hypothetical protein
LHKHRPISLYPTIHPPSLGEVPSDRRIAVGLELLITLYKNIDHTFINLWNRVQKHANPAWLVQVQTQLSEAVPAYLECTETQEVEVRITQQWLKAMAWQLCVGQGLVSIATSGSCMTLEYPSEISRDLLTMTHHFSQPAMEVHGAELVGDFLVCLCLEQSCSLCLAVYVPKSIRSRNPYTLTSQPTQSFLNFLMQSHPQHTGPKLKPWSNDSAG